MNLQLIYGLPGETLDGFRRSIDWGLQFGCHVTAGVALVLPGTELARQAKELGIIHGAEPPYETLETSTMSREDFRQASKLSTIVYSFTSSAIANFSRPLLKLARRAPQQEMSRLAVYEEWMEFLRANGLELKQEWYGLEEITAGPLLRAALACSLKKFIPFFKRRGGAAGNISGTSVRVGSAAWIPTAKFRPPCARP